MTLNEYISALRDALRTPGAHAFYFPADRKRRKEANLRLARELGFGLKDYPQDVAQDILGGTYSQLVVANSLDSTGVAIDNKEWLNAVRAVAFDT